MRNADGDEIYFVHAGRGRFETDYGVLAYEPGDYIVIPKGTTYRLVLESDKSSLFVIVETTAPVELPDRGSLGHHALFDKGVLVAPELPPQASDDRQSEWEVRIERVGVGSPAANQDGFVGRRAARTLGGRAAACGERGEDRERDEVDDESRARGHARFVRLALISARSLAVAWRAAVAKSPPADA